MSALLEIEGLTSGYAGAPVLREITLGVPEGSLLAVLGANGAGKTTLLRTISGLLRPWAGTVRFGGRDLTRLSVERIARLGLGHVPAGGGVITELTVAENLRLGGLWQPDRRATAQAESEVYELFPALAARRDQPGQQLSGGERQMLAIGRALVSRPAMLLLDEPSLGLAPRVTSQLMELLKQQCRERGLTVLLVEQNVRAALAVADHAVIVALGRVAVTDSAGHSPTELLGDDTLRHAYLGF
jgi:branched-chain amino acid transport system ATP-binding protein